jgi:hypothetical protein
VIRVRVRVLSAHSGAGYGRPGLRIRVNQANGRPHRRARRTADSGELPFAGIPPRLKVARNLLKRSRPGRAGHDIPSTKMAGFLQSNHTRLGPIRAGQRQSAADRPMSAYTSVCSAISRASLTSIPRYRTVLSIFVWPSRSWTARRFFVRR